MKHPHYLGDKPAPAPDAYRLPQADHWGRVRDALPPEYGLSLLGDSDDIEVRLEIVVIKRFDGKLARQMAPEELARAAVASIRKVEIKAP